MSQQRANDTVDKLVNNGRDLVQKANRRHVVIRESDGTKLIDLNLTMIAIIVFLLVVVQPIGTIVAVGALAYGLFKKVKIEIVRELSTDDNVIDVKLPQE